MFLIVFPFFVPVGKILTTVPLVLVSLPLESLYCFISLLRNLLCTFCLHSDGYTGGPVFIFSMLLFLLRNYIFWYGVVFNTVKRIIRGLVILLTLFETWWEVVLTTSSILPAYCCVLVLHPFILETTGNPFLGHIYYNCCIISRMFLCFDCILQPIS